MRKPTVLSLFSGIGGFDLGLERAGFEVVAQCDNDAFCNKVLAKHWPEVRRFDDVRDIRVGPAQRDLEGQPDDGEADQPDFARAGHVDLIVGGFPCQDLSVAGKRAGLAGDRSGLWFEFHRILSELRPAFCIIENVPGLLSSNEGRDFAVILNGLGELGYVCGWAVLDSQHFGVPQRRRRVYIIGGPTRASVQQILSLCEGGDWHPAKGRAAGQDVAYALSASVRGTGDGHGNAWNTSYVAYGGNRTGGPLDVAAALQAHGGPNGLQDFSSETFLLAHSLRADGFDASEDGMGRGSPLVSVRTAQTGSNGWGINEDGTAYTLDGTQGQAVATSTVRRLTPVECERLQGFPDGWTQLDDKTPDGPRYKALGNAVTVPVIEYLGTRIREVLAR